MVNDTEYRLEELFATKQLLRKEVKACLGHETDAYSKLTTLVTEL
jgi:hypothetical protein